MITELKDNEVFVFGSNLAGRHGAGAAKQAIQWGAVYGVGEGLRGQTYALPTLDAYLQKRSIKSINTSVILFFDCVYEHPELTFLVTEVGCGLAGFDPEEIAPLFVDAPLNVIIPERFLEIINRIKEE